MQAMNYGAVMLELVDRDYSVASPHNHAGWDKPDGIWPLLKDRWVHDALCTHKRAGYCAELNRAIATQDKRCRICLNPFPASMKNQTMLKIEGL